MSGRPIKRTLRGHEKRFRVGHSHAVLRSDTSPAPLNIACDDP